MNANWKDINVQRFFFEHIAKKKGFDPILQPELWTVVSYRDILQQKGGKSVVQLYGGSFRKAISACFPQALLDAPGKWKGNLHKQGEFFENIAHQKGFHPVKEAHRWFNVPLREIISYGGAAILELHGTLFKALKAVFPNIELAKPITEQYLKANPHFQREFFDQLARQSGFDAIKQPHKWSSITKQNIFSHEVGISWCIR